MESPTLRMLPYTLHYLCRPDEVEDVSVKVFCEKYEVAYAPKKQNKDNPVMPFKAETGFFCHPSAVLCKRGKDKGKKLCRQGIRRRADGDVLSKVSQWAWPDTGHFHHSILTCADSEINRVMEKYSQLVLTLLVPHRSSCDLQLASELTYPYTHMLRKLYSEDSVRKSSGEQPWIFSEENMTFLQNIQNCRHNSLRYKVQTDDLAGCTVPFENPDAEADSGLYNVDEVEEDMMNQLGYEDFLDTMDEEFDRPRHDDDPDFFPQHERLLIPRNS